MRKITAVLLLSVLIGAVGCGLLGKNPAQPDLSAINLDDPRAVAEGLFNKTMSDSQVVLVASKQLEFNLQVARELFRLDGKSADEVDAMVQGLRTELTAPEESRRAAGTFSAAEACDQWVEHKTVVRDPVWAAYTTSFQSSRGTEYVCYFNPWWTVDSNNIRWGASDPRVFWGLYLPNGGKLWGFHLCSKPHQLLVGNNAVAAAGGQYWVMANLYVHHL